MKKIILSFILSVALLGSCTKSEVKFYDEYGYGNFKTEYPNHIFEGSKELINIIVGSLDMAVKADEWQVAVTEENKLLVEDRYFPQHKLRENGDTIQLIYAVEPTDRVNMRFIRDGKSINQEGASWIMETSAYDSDALSFRRVGHGRWHVTHEGSDFFGVKCDIYISRIMVGETGYTNYLVSGRAEGIALICSDAPYVEFEIDGTMTLTTTVDYVTVIGSRLSCELDECAYMYSDSRLKIENGELRVIEVDDSDNNEEYPAEIKIHSYSAYTINYRGVSEDWGSNIPNYYL